MTLPDATFAFKSLVNCRLRESAQAERCGFEASQRKAQQIPRHSPNVKDPRAGRVQADTKLTSPSLYLRHLEAPHAGTHNSTHQ